MNTLCKIRDVYRSIADFEVRLEEEYGICLNEGMLLCSLSDNNILSSGEIAVVLGLKTSNASKVIKAAEVKGLIKRILGDSDKRQMYFSLTPKGLKLLLSISCTKIGIPESLSDVVGE